jgi:hypothetical protein
MFCALLSMDQSAVCSLIQINVRNVGQGIRCGTRLVYFCVRHTQLGIVQRYPFHRGQDIPAVLVRGTHSGWTSI